MTKAEAFDKAWRLAIKSDFSLFDEIVHPEYESLHQGIKEGQQSPAQRWKHTKDLPPTGNHG